MDKLNVDELLESIRCLGELQENWDGYGASLFSKKDTISHCKNIVSLVYPLLSNRDFHSLIDLYIEPETNDVITVVLVKDNQDKFMISVGNQIVQVTVPKNMELSFRYFDNHEMNKAKLLENLSVWLT